MDNTTGTVESIESFLDAQPWGDILEELTGYAHKCMRLLFWKGVLNGHPPGHEASDFAVQAIEAVYDGRRKWDPLKYSNLRWYLRQVVWSLVRNAANKIENRMEMEFPEKEIAAPSMPFMIGDEDTFVLEFVEYLNDEPDLQQVIYCMDNGVTERGAIATALGVSPSDITNMKKRLSRRITAFRTLQARRS